MSPLGQFIAANQIRFCQKILDANCTKFNSILCHPSGGRYPTMDYLLQMKNSGLLNLKENNFSIFNTRYNGSAGTVYSLNQ